MENEIAPKELLTKPQAELEYCKNFIKDIIISIREQGSENIDPETKKTVNIWMQEYRKITKESRDKIVDLTMNNNY